jgi:hypothetical protein
MSAKAREKDFLSLLSIEMTDTPWLSFRPFGKAQGKLREKSFFNRAPKTDDN